MNYANGEDDSAIMIAIEGIDGAGKATQVKALACYLQARGYSVKIFSFPQYETTLGGQLVRQYLSGQFGEMCSLPPIFPAMLYALDRFEANADIDAAREMYDFIIFDRYTLSNVAYQCARVSGEREQVKLARQIHAIERTLFQCFEPDLHILLDVPVDVSAGRMTGRKRDAHERNAEFLTAVRERYLDMARTQGSRIVYVDGSKPVDEVTDVIITGVEKKYLAKKSDRGTDTKGSPEVHVCRAGGCGKATADVAPVTAEDAASLRTIMQNALDRVFAKHGVPITPSSDTPAAAPATTPAADPATTPAADTPIGPAERDCADDDGLESTKSLHADDTQP